MEIDDVIKQAKQTLQTFGHHVSMGIFHKTSEEVVIIGLVMQSITDKIKCREFLVDFVKKGDIDFYFIILEGWYSKQGKGEKMKIPSQQPDRKSCLIINKFYRDMREEGTVILFEKKGTEIVFGEEEKLEKELSRSRFNPYKEYIEPICGDVVK